MICRSLGTAAYSLRARLLLTLFLFLNAGLFFSIAAGTGSLWLALGVYLAAECAAEFSREYTARNVILFGASIALLEVVDPLGGMVAGLLLPLCVTFTRPRETLEHKAGLYVLLLFIPVAAAALLAYLDTVLHADVGRTITDGARGAAAAGHVPHGTTGAVIGAAILMVPALWLTSRRKPLNRMNMAALATGISVVIAAGAAGMIGAHHSAESLFGAMAAASATAIATWRPSAHRTTIALLAAGTGAFLSWVFLLALA
jgi:hypothetical protein